MCRPDLSQALWLPKLFQRLQSVGEGPPEVQLHWQG